MTTTILPQAQVVVPRVLGKKKPHSPKVQSQLDGFRPTGEFVKGWHVGDDRLLLFEGSDSRTLLLLDRRSFEILWAWQDPLRFDRIDSHAEDPILTDSLVFLVVRGTERGAGRHELQRILALDLRTGTLAWEARWTRGPDAPYRWEPRVLLEGDSLWACLADGQFVVVESATGKTRDLAKDPDFLPYACDASSMTMVGTYGRSSVVADRVHKRPISALPPFVVVDARTGRRKFTLQPPDLPRGYDVAHIHAADGWVYIVLCGDDHPRVPGNDQFIYERWPETRIGSLLGDRVLTYRADTGERAGDLTLPWHVGRPYFQGCTMQAFGKTHPARAFRSSPRIFFKARSARARESPRAGS